MNSNARRAGKGDCELPAEYRSRGHCPVEGAGASLGPPFCGCESGRRTRPVINYASLMHQRHFEKPVIL